MAVAVAVICGLTNLVFHATASGAATARAAVHAVASPVTTPTVPIPAAAPTVPATTAAPRSSASASASASTASGRTTATKAPVRTGTHRVTATAGKGVAVRSRPDPAATLLGRKAEGAALTITCQVKGTLVRDTTQNRSSTLWDKLSTGGYVANIYTTAYEPTKAGYSTGLKACPASATSTTAKATATTVKTNATAPEVATEPSAATSTGTGSAGAGASTATTQPGAITVKTTVTSAN